MSEPEKRAPGAPCPEGSLWRQTIDAEASVELMARGRAPEASRGEPCLCPETPSASERPVIEKRSSWWDYPRFRSKRAKVLLVSLRHLLLSEIKGALEALGHTARVMMIPAEEMELGGVERLYTETIKEFKPDFLLTVNHLGFDREGFVTHLLESMKIPIASWYVDSPYLILGHYKKNSSPMLTLFLWDRDYVPMLKGVGLERVYYLPLGADHTIFKPEKAASGRKAERLIDVGFVGNSMVIKSRSALGRSGAGEKLLKQYKDICANFLKSPHLIVRDLLRERFPDLIPQLRLLGEDRALAFESSVIWQATGRYRRDLLLAARAYRPIVAGDPGWTEILDSEFKIRPELNYYAELPAFYRACKVSFNATSRQMKNGVNQRVFDVPACGGVLLTDHTRQLEEMFEPGREILAYSNADEIPLLLERALKDRGFREAVSEAGLKRVLAEHTYVHRTARLVEVMRSLYA